MCKKTLLLISLVLVLGLVGSGWATNYYVRPNGGSYGSEDGSDWSNAFDGFSDVVWGSSAGQVGAGDILYVAGGTYTQNLAPGASGTSDSVRIIVRRATVSEHGTSTGWNSSFDAQVVLPNTAYIRVYQQSYITIDGVTEYGFYVDSPTSSNSYGIYVNDSDYVTVQYIKTDGTNNGDDFRGMYWLNAGNTKVRHCWFNDCPNDAIMIGDVTDSLVEYCTLGPRISSSTGKHADGMEVRATEDITFRYNEMNWNGDGILFGIVGGVTLHWDIHGNIFRGEGTSLKANSVDPSITQIYIYNNVFYNLYTFFVQRSNTSGIAKNNIFYDVTNIGFGGGLTHDYNWFAGSDDKDETNGIAGGSEDPFEDKANLDFHLDSSSTAIDAGTNVGSTYNTDPDGNTRGGDGDWDIGAYEYVSGAPDTTAPSPDPMTWSTDPYATGDTSISMTATTATDVSGVEYYFDCITSGGHDSGWQNGTTYEDTGLSASTQYTYQVKARDKSSNQNETAYSTTKSATTNAADTTAPSPDPMTWATEPNATGTSSISMTATTATDTSGVEYYFDETSGNPGGNDSGWQDGTTYEDTGLSPSTQYTYQVKARDKSTNQNETAYSTTKSATTDAADTTAPSPDPMTWATEPNATGTSSISMTATTATDSSGVEYYFDCTTTGGHDSGWQDSTTYQDTSLDPNTQYSYRVKARDKSTNQNETAYSTVKSATTDAESTGAFQQDSGSEGIVSMEAENYDANTPRSDHAWVLITTPTGFSGSAAMRSEPDNSANINTGYAANSPQLDYEVNFVKTGTHYVWIRGYKTSGTDDSCHAGLDGQEISTSDRIGLNDANSWEWTNYTMDGPDATFDVNSTGVKTVNVWMREDGFRVDKIVLTVDANYTPTGNGPAESSRGGGDTTAPSPDPMTWATEPYSTGTSSISMTATTATDASGVEYYFDCTAGGGTDSGWQDSTTYEDTGLSELTEYTYRVKARDKSSNLNETAYSTTKSATTQDGTAPSPDPMTWSTEPYATGASSISMTVTTATDASGVEYYFDCTAGGGNDSGWQDSTTYEDTGLSELTEYTYRVKARDKSSNQNETAYSTTKSATTEDGTAPSPDPMTWATEPYATGVSSISMTATTATDTSGVEYSFDCTAGGGNDSGWQDSATYEDTGLSASTQYTYRVQARDKSSNQNTTGWSTTKSATTDVEAEPNLVSWWKLDESSGTTVDDSSGNNHDGTLSGGSWAPTGGKFDGAVELGTDANDYVEVPTTGMSASAGTISVWGRLEGTQSASRYFFGHTSGSGPSGWADRIQLYMDNDDNQLDLGLGGSHESSLNIMTLSANTWYHIALTWDGTNYVVYVDGISKASGTYTGLSTLNSIADIGNNGNTTYRSEAFQGLLDDGSIYDQALSKYDIADLAGITIASSPSPADEATDVSITADLSWSAGYYAADVNGHDVYLGTDYNSVADANHSSAEFKGTQSSTTYDPGTMSNSTTYYWAIDEVNDSNTWAGEVFSFTTAGADTTAPSPDPMTWATEPNATGSTSISMTATTATDASGVEYYFDCTAGGGNDSGWQDSTTYEDTGLSPETQYTYKVRARDKSTNQNATGWSTEKSATTETGADPNLVSWWKLDESSGTTAADSSGNSHDGTLSGGSWAPTSGKYDGAVDLGDATSDRVQIPTTSMSASAGTVALWGRIVGTQSTERYFFGHTSSPSGWVDRIQLYMDSGDNKLDLGLGDSHTRDTDIMTLSADTWYHIALTWDGSNYVVYVDGDNDANGTYTGLSSLGSIADIGNDGNASYRTEAFQGLLDQVRVYDKALSQSEVQDLAGE